MFAASRDILSNECFPTVLYIYINNNINIVAFIQANSHTPTCTSYIQANYIYEITHHDNIYYHKALYIRTCMYKCNNTKHTK